MLEKQRGRTDVSDATVAVNVFVSICIFNIRQLSWFLIYTVRLAPEEISAKLTGYEHNGVTCIGMKTDIPVSTSISDFDLIYQKISSSSNPYGHL